jgi:hypothetical protein
LLIWGISNDKVLSRKSLQLINHGGG